MSPLIFLIDYLFLIISIVGLRDEELFFYEDGKNSIYNENSQLSKKVVLLLYMQLVFHNTYIYRKVLFMINGLERVIIFFLFFGYTRDSKTAI